LKEIEACYKIDIKQAEKLRNKLKKYFKKKITETDVYFFPPHRDFLTTKNGKENLRVRDAETKKELTYKKVFYNNYDYSHSIEKNIPLSDTKEAIELLKMLGFREHLTVQKKRELFENNKFIITIDNVKNLGHFAEIEHKGQTNNRQNALTECHDLAKKLGLTEVEKKGYLRLLEEKLEKPC
jgi:adenylate cyclase class 2